MDKESERSSGERRDELNKFCRRAERTCSKNLDRLKEIYQPLCMVDD